MKAKIGTRMAYLLILMTLVCGSAAALDMLTQPFDLAGERAPEERYYHMETKVLQYALDGKRTGADVYHLKLKCVPAVLSGKDSDVYTCQEITMQKQGAVPVTVPALANWSYLFTPNAEGIDEKGQLFSIDHSKFENLVDSSGNPLTPDTAYMVYNTFIDFHSFCDVFARPPRDGAGIQDLKTVGQKIVHAAAFSKVPVNLGSNVDEGSYFTNGEITLEFKGLSRVDGKTCAIVAFDSGESSFNMRLQPMPGMNIETMGSSHYFGDIYIDMESKWVQKAHMAEFVVTEVRLPMPPNKLNTVIERDVTIWVVNQAEVEMD